MVLHCKNGVLLNISGALSSLVIKANFDNWRAKCMPWGTTLALLNVHGCSNYI